MFIDATRQFILSLKNLDAILTKAERSAEARKFDINNFCTARLAPDMLPFPRQVQIACDAAKLAVSLISGKEAPRFEDNEKNFDELHERIRKTLAYLESVRPEDFAHVTPKTTVKLRFPEGQAMFAHEFLLGRAMPNFFFHVTTTYNLLRAGGVDLGKSDFLGPLNMFPA